MLPKSASLGTGLAVGGLVVAIYMQATPTVADVRVGDPGDRDIDSAERAAAWQSAGIVAAISLLARDPNIFIIGGAVTIGMAWMYRHANEVNPLTGKASTVMLGGRERDDMADAAAPTLAAVG